MIIERRIEALKRTTEPAIFRRLTSNGQLTRDDIMALARLPWVREVIEPQQSFDADERFCILASGIMCRLSQTPSGRRQLLGLVLPGDVCDYAVVTGSPVRLPHIAMSRATVMSTSLEAFTVLVEDRPAILASLLTHMTIDHATVQEHVLSLGCRTALERMAHFLCELDFRFSRMGLGENHQFSFSLTQAELGEYLGLSAVHVNRTMQELRRRGLIVTQGNRFTLSDVKNLRLIAGFSAHYLDGRAPSRLENTAA